MGTKSSKHGLLHSKRLPGAGALAARSPALCARKSRPTPSLGAPAGGAGMSHPAPSDDHSLHEECGVVGAFSFKDEDVAPLLYRALIALQHRGQDSAGMATFDGKRIKNHRELGLVASVFDEKTVGKLAGHAGIGHVRYPTIGAGGKEDAQPFAFKQPFGGIALAHNGNIANYGTLRRLLEEKGLKFCSTCDSYLILEVFVRQLQAHGLDIFKASAGLMKELDGSYSVCAVTAKNQLIVMRDPHAIRPLCWGKTDDVIMFASESVALDINQIPLCGDIAPGEVLIIGREGIRKKSVMAEQPRHCIFEYVYFSRPDSVEEGKLVYEVRAELGRRLARSAPAQADIVVPVPDTSRPAAEGYSQVSGIPLVEGLIKNRYVGRTFIMPSQPKRLEAVRLKLNAVRGLVGGKRIVLIDDSIVRGTTSGPIVKLLRNAGAKEVHLRIACPPVVSPCFYGVDLPTFTELIAANKSVEEIRAVSGADSLAYVSIDDLVGAIGKNRADLCMGCLNGDYPTELGNRIAKMMKTRGAHEGVRIWEEKVL